MSTEKAELLSIVEKFSGTPMLVIGDLILDHYVWGKVNRISPEAPVVVVQVTEESRRPGGAGNVANNLSALGAAVSVCGLVGDDDDGRALLELLEARAIDASGVLVDRTRPTTVKTRVIAHAQQVVRVDREIAAPISESYREGIAAALQAKLGHARGIVVSDYAKGVICEPIFRRIEQGFEQGVLGLGKAPVIVDPKCRNLGLYSRATVIKPNRSEAEEASGISINSRAKAIEAGGILLDRWNCDMVLITLGEMGMVLVSKMQDQEPVIEVETMAREVYDVSGAGDTVSAVFALSLSVGATSRQAALLANYAAGIVVAEVGTVAVTEEQLRDVLRS